MANDIYVKTGNVESIMLEKICSFILSKGFTFDEETIQNFYLSLKTKPFVILTGISGTGKTKIVQLFVESIYGREKDLYFDLVPVQPDWTAPRFMLGFFNPLTESYERKPLLDIMMNAKRDEKNSYFVCLDEMNLARVEYYFSAFLSAMESGEPIPLHDNDKLPVEKKIPKKMTIPSNLFFIGTVNIDETTHQFSHKVLDRANTIEFNDADLLAHFRNDSKKITEIIVPEEFNKEFLKSKEETGKWKVWKDEKGKQCTEQYINPIYDILRKSNLHFGYRVRDEILVYMFWAWDLGTRINFMDMQIMQKILPKIKGGPRIKKTLDELKEFLIKKDMKKSANRVEEMIKQLDEEGYTSFWR